MTDRPAITARMKVDSLLQRVFVQFGSYLKDPTGEDLKPGCDLVFDHMHALTFDGEHTYMNLRPILRQTNAEKAKQETKDYWKLKRLRGETKGRVSKPIQSRGFDKTKTRRFDGSVVRSSGT